MLVSASSNLRIFNQFFLRYYPALGLQSNIILFFFFHSSWDHIQFWSCLKTNSNTPLHHRHSLNSIFQFRWEWSIYICSIMPPSQLKASWFSRHGPMGPHSGSESYMSRVPSDCPWDHVLLSDMLMTFWYPLMAPYWHQCQFNQQSPPFSLMTTLIQLMLPISSCFYFLPLWHQWKKGTPLLFFFQSSPAFIRVYVFCQLYSLLPLSSRFFQLYLPLCC